jgi:hypothetical protein
MTMTKPFLPADNLRRGDPRHVVIFDSIKNFQRIHSIFDEAYNLNMTHSV